MSLRIEKNRSGRYNKTRGGLSMIFYPKTEQEVNIFVNNEKRVGEVLGIKLEHGEDLRKKMETEEVKTFWNTYEVLLHSTNRKDMIAFYQETGLRVLHVIEESRYGLKLVMDSNGVVFVGGVPKDLPSIEIMDTSDLKIFQHHLLVVTKVDKLIEEAGKIYTIRGDYKRCVYDVAEEKEYAFPLNRYVRAFNELVCASRNLEKRIEVIQNIFGKSILDHIAKEEIIQVELIPTTRQLYILLKNGDLYEWDKVYAKKVRYIWAMNNYCYYVIYEDNTVEPLAFIDAITEPIKQYKKIIYQPGFVERLLRINKENDVELIETKDDSFEVNITEYEQAEEIKEAEGNIFVVCKGEKEEVLLQKSMRSAIRLEPTKEEKMPQKILVHNHLKVGEALGIEVEDGEDILLRKEVQGFIRKYGRYFNSCKPEDIQEFFEQTGIYLTFRYQATKVDCAVQTVLVNQNGVYIPKEYTLDDEYVFHEHLLVCYEVESLQIRNHKVIADGEEIGVNLNYYAQNWEDKLEFEEKKDPLVSRRYLMEKQYLVPKQEFVYITLDLFHQVVSLTSKGEVYVNQKLYAKNVKHIVEFNKKDIYFIYENNTIEEYTSSQINNRRVKQYDKILYGDNFLVTLKESVAILYFFPINSTCELLEDETFEIFFEEVEDIAIENTDELVLFKNGGKIRVPMAGIIKKS